MSIDVSRLLLCQPADFERDGEQSNALEIKWKASCSSRVPCAIPARCASAFLDIWTGNALFEERGMINALGVRRDKHSENNLRNFLDHRAGHGGTVRSRFTMRGRRERNESRRRRETERGREKKSRSRIDRLLCRQSYRDWTTGTGIIRTKILGDCTATDGPIESNVTYRRFFCLFVRYPLYSIAFY